MHGEGTVTALAHRVQVGAELRRAREGLGLAGVATDLQDEDGQPFNGAALVPYAYRHSYAQRHADNGVPPDVLRDLMSHRSMQTTLTYYRVTENQAAVAAMRKVRKTVNLGMPGNRATNSGGHPSR
jgi:integrase